MGSEAGDGELGAPGAPEGGFDPRAFLETVPSRPGSYRMYNAAGEVIYVGKAKDLRRRLSSYFLKDLPSVKTRALVSRIHHIEFTVTFSETEALLLENELIKKYQPRYNILLRDDKSYPCLLLTAGRHPALRYHRGAHREEGEYFGPFPDGKAVRESLRLLQGIFPIRQCADTVYAHRARPCLLASLGRCLAPCVPMGEGGEERYQEQVRLVRLFLSGRNQELLQDLTRRMGEHSERLEFEQAARCRDQLQALRRVQESQHVSASGSLDLDVLAVAQGDEVACVHVLFVRGGRVLGTRSYFPRLGAEGGEEEVLASFAAQFYLSERRAERYPEEIILDREVPGEEELRAAIEGFSGQRLKISHAGVRTERAGFLELCAANARASLQARLSSAQTARARIEDLERILGLSGIARMECFDISHTLGELTVASCVVFGREGPETSRYRRLNIEGITPGDDFAAMRQAFTRRYSDLGDGAEIPDLIFVDGGPGQLAVAEEVIGECFAQAGRGVPPIVAVAKGEGRKAGLETLIRGYTHEEFHLSLSDPGLQLVLHIRDESHRFAITGHRGRRLKARTHSPLEDIEGIGSKRRQALLRHLGGRQEVMRAGIDEIAKVPGISRALAERIYAALHDGG
ncbi:MAG: excinuclease ABC subunit UvrC [Succinivibrionaceae bacterium]|nr:excinuclease ABC subunit UvrC [Succinivibrionaceae bacterium]